MLPRDALQKLLQSRFLIPNQSWKQFVFNKQNSTTTANRFRDIDGEKKKDIGNYYYQERGFKFGSRDAFAAIQKVKICRWSKSADPKSAPSIGFVVRMPMTKLTLCLPSLPSKAEADDDGDTECDTAMICCATSSAPTKPFNSRNIASPITLRLIWSATSTPSMLSCCKTAHLKLWHLHSHYTHRGSSTTTPS